MNGKEEIIQSILSDAETTAEKLRQDAADSANSIVLNARQAADLQLDKLKERSKEQASELKKRRLAVAELDIRKIALAEKQQLLSWSFSGALQKLCSMPQKERLALLSNLLSKFAETGESVIVAERDKAHVTEAFLEKSAPGRQLKLSKQAGAFEGGLVLTGNGYEKNLTFEVLLDEIREEIEPQVSKILFRES